MAAPGVTACLNAVFTEDTPSPFDSAKDITPVIVIARVPNITRLIPTFRPKP